MVNHRVVSMSGLVVVVALLLVPQLGYAQSGIAGTVRDTSGAVLPGVTVEATSPVLIERVRSAVTGSDGNYTIGDLRPGVYAVTFTLPGFSVVKREGIELPAAFTATVSVSLQVGAIEETITVTGSAPLVDTRSATSSTLLTRDMLDTLPSSSRSPQSYAALTPGVRGASLSAPPGGVNDMGASAHGGAASDYQIDGITTATINGMQGGSITFRIAQAYVGEITIMTGGGGAESAHGNMITNVIPKEGGNTFSGGFYYEYTGAGLASSNLTPALSRLGFTADGLTRAETFWEVSPYIGGRILRDKLWFFASYKDYKVDTIRQGMYDNLTPLGWAYTPDSSYPSIYRLTQTSRNARLTWQAAPKHKISAFVDNAPQIAWHRSEDLVSPEATNYSPYLPNIFVHVSWKSPLTNNWLLESSLARNSSNYDQRRQTPETCLCSAPSVGLDVIGKYEATTGIQWGAASTLGGRAESHLYGANDSRMIQVQASATHVTGAHTTKVGIQMIRGEILFVRDPNLGRAYTLRNGRPSAITLYATPYSLENFIKPSLSTYVQDQWVYRRLTLTGGLRHDYFRMTSPENRLGAGPFVGERFFPEETLGIWKDLSPRVGVSYDLFGDGKTAVKMSFGRFVSSQDGAPTRGLGRQNPAVRSILSANRPWNDANSNFTVDCDLNQPFENGECGTISNLNFGRANPNALSYDPKLTTGYRPYHWETTAQVQRQIRDGMSVTLGWYRRSFKNNNVNRNVEVPQDVFDPYCVTAPLDPRLPNGGGYELCGLYDVRPAYRGRSRIVVSHTEDFGEHSQTYNGIDLTQNTLIRGMVFTGGVSIDRSSTKRCYIVNSPQDLLYCNDTRPFLPFYTFTGFVPLPWDMVTGAVYRDRPGPAITASYNVRNADIVPTLGRNLSAGPNGTVNVPLIQPGTMYGPRQRQLDVRFSKRFRVGRARLMGNVDLANVLNAASATAYNNTYGPNWQNPTAIQLGRFVKFGAQLDF
jgi:hypothetical protein